jgi:hypothetical protein
MIAIRLQGGPFDGRRAVLGEPPPRLYALPCRCALGCSTGWRMSRAAVSGAES